MKKVHIITGGSSGIGLECAKKFDEGIVVITGRNEQKLIRATEELKQAGINAVYKQGDVSKPENLKELFEYASTLGEVCTVVNSAGVSGVSEELRQIFEIDLLGTENLAEMAKDYLTAGGVVILLASMMGHVIPPNPAYDTYLTYPSTEGAVDALIEFSQHRPDVAYNFSKRGVHLIAKRFAWEYGQKGFRILSLSPGIIMTPMSVQALEAHPDQMNFMKSVTPAGRFGEPEDIANMVHFLASEKASFITGTDILVDGGLTLKLVEMMNSAEPEE
ncbi:MAG: SDR family oxidoreductase [Tissierellia bacterium]|nr:SDR family oxidoreductase [Tissierellia bacterium]